ncbi:ATPase V1 complex subunit H [Syncephalastrum racemosum]|uniref:V-type proton ATPase subunit H n=1 Tax=Syncephalastrum racemosum TaxID=13706 RepID=A0A1X2H483_SYNRA|nr:ATPase V1 complex subunit H [Syncephalastrum racemosum]
MDVSLAFVSNPYLDKKASQARQRSILWEGYERANLLSHDQVELVKAIDKASPEQIQQAVKGKGDAYAALILHLLEKLSRPDTVQYVCILADSILSGDESNAKYFHNLTATNGDYPYEPFIKALRSGEELTDLEASKILTILSCMSPTPAQTDVTALCKWLSMHLASPNPQIMDLAVQETESLLGVREYRNTFWNTQNAVNHLVQELDKGSATPQIQYQIIFCLWLLTFEKDIASKINSQYDIIPKLVSIAKGAIKEKVIRVTIATLRNLVEKAPADNLAAMLVVKLLPFTENLSTRKWSDTDIVEDIDFIKEKLQENFQSLTTFEQYASEVETGMLEWSPPHTSELFWKENASRLEENNYSLLRSLARILSTATSTQVLAIAANDVGHYVKYSSKGGKRFLHDIGAKQRIMELMTHEDQDVRYQALSAVQKYMHQAWDF